MTTEQTDRPDDATDVDQPGTAETPAEPETDDPTRKARSEAAAYRRRLRDTEGERDTLAAERDQLRARLDDRQRADVETLAGQRLRDGSDLWTATTLTDLLDEEGEVDPALVAQAVDQLAAAKPHYAKPGPGASFDLGARPVAPTEHSFADVLRGGR